MLQYPCKYTDEMLKPTIRLKWIVGTGVVIAIIIMLTRNIAPQQCEGLQSDYISAPSHFPTTEHIFALLSVSEVAAVVRLIKLNCSNCIPFPENHVEYKRTVIAYAVYLKLDICSKLHLEREEPPADVHAMSRGPGYTAGGLYSADIMIQAMHTARVRFQPRTFLDFGGSSGRVARAVKAAFLNSEVHVCDPNAKTIRWLQANNNFMTASVSSQYPPLVYGNSYFDAIFAVSIWSHFAQSAARQWLLEMHRILQKDGILVLSTHGWQAVRYYSNIRALTDVRLRKVQADLNVHGFSFYDSFGPKGDWGVINPKAEWGQAFFTHSWLYATVKSHFVILAHVVGLMGDNQDVYVLRKT